MRALAACSPLHSLPVGRHTRSACRALFDAFTRGDTRGDGTGLGLFIARELCSNLGGALFYEGSGGTGARFVASMALRRSTQQTEVAQTSTEASTAGSNGVNAVAGKRLLLAEDDATIRRLTTRLLTKAGANVLAVDDGSEALAQVADWAPHIVLTDIMMPEMDGFALIQSLRANGFAGPIIGITAAMVGDEAERLVARGADYRIAQPLNMDELDQVLTSTTA